MTREEAIETLKLLKPNMRFDKSGWLYAKQAFEMAIQALSQEPTDAVSREAVYQLLLNMASSAYGFEEIRRIADKLPSVTHKLGKWQRVSIDKYIQHAMAYYECSECGGQTIGEPKFCSNCGAKMESEDEK